MAGAGGKAKTPAPIDRPLSRAYLREFSGLSTAYPPGLSDPTSLRTMENVMVNRDGSLRIRPGLRYLSYFNLPTPTVPGTGLDKTFVGTHEAFYLNDGTKAYLFAVREIGGEVGFRVLKMTTSSAVIYSLTAAGIDFTIPQGVNTINFTAATTYVKYLQIDNKIFALSDAGESMRMFIVDGTKTVKKLTSITRPNFDVPDKLSIIHPADTFITNGESATRRKNLFANPSFTWLGHVSPSAAAYTKATASTTLPRTGTTSLRLESLPERTNLVRSPLHDVATTGITGWFSGDGPTSVSGTYLRLEGNNVGTYYAQTFSLSGVEANVAYRVAFDTGSPTNVNTHRSKVEWYSSSGTLISSNSASHSASSTRFVTAAYAAPAGAVSAKVFLGHVGQGAPGSSFSLFKNVMLAKIGEPTTMFTGSSGANYLWAGTVNDSASIYHPPKDIHVDCHMNGQVGESYSFLGLIASAYFRSGSTSRTCAMAIASYDSGGNLMALSSEVTDTSASGAWSRPSLTVAGPSGAVDSLIVLRVKAVPRGEYHYIDNLLVETGSVGLQTYFDGDTTGTADLLYAWEGTANDSLSTSTDYATGAAIPTAETPGANTLISNVPATNIYNYGFFYTFNNEVGESAASQVTTLKAKRGWPSWFWETPTTAGEPSGTATADPTKAADQLIAIMPQAVFNAAVAQGALSWSLYMLTWSDQDSVPVVGLKVAQRAIEGSKLYTRQGWARMTPQQNTFDDSAGIPNAENRYNYSNPSSGGQGIVAADRMVMVKDPTAAAVIKYSSNQQGDYTNFSAAKGGGYKTLTSGNLYIPACVKLWQNPQSADTLTILCKGTDGHSTSYYMAPAQVTSQSDTTNIMGFEETTATPGTVSPYGVEVFNNTLYHPLDEQLMKSTASNYNINHKSMTDQIENLWLRFATKEKMISSQHDGRLYYIVNNPDGETLMAGCNGNEIWVLDAGAEKGTWSRLLIQATSLRKIEQGGKMYMSVSRPDGLFYLDPLYYRDDYVVPGALTVLSRPIPWRAETNTQGANRAHDAWAHLQQVGLSLGNFHGRMKWGVSGWDLNGQPVNKSKIISVPESVEPNFAPFDRDDALEILRDMQQWFFYASSVEIDGVTAESGGQINSVQYRYTPVSVNVGYEWGSVETFEYGRSLDLTATGNTDAGIPQPMMDTRRP